MNEKDYKKLTKRNKYFSQKDEREIQEKRQRDKKLEEKKHLKHINRFFEAEAEEGSYDEEDDFEYRVSKRKNKKTKAEMFKE